MLSSPSDPPTDIGVEDKSRLSSSEPQTSWYKKAIKYPFFRRKKPHSLSSDSPMNVTMQKNTTYEPQEVKLTGSSVHGADRIPLSTSDQTDVEMMQNPSYETTTPRLGVDADHEYNYIKANGQKSAHKDMEGILTANVDMTCNPSYQPIRHH